MRSTATFQRFNDRQRQALDGNRNLAVRAGAGSGKTSVLIERIVQLLARSWDQGTPLSLTALVALTFTRKAAAELQGRLRASFTQMAQQAADLQETSFWNARIDELPRTMIGTIDSFCARVLREFGHLDPSPIHIDPAFEPLADYDETVLKREAIERVVDRLSALPSWEKSAQLLEQAGACRWWGEEEGYETLIQHLTALLDHLIDPDLIRASHPGLDAAAEQVAVEWGRLPVVARLKRDQPALKAALQQLLLVIGGQKRPGTRLMEMRTRVEATLAQLGGDDPMSETATLAALRTALFTDQGEPRKQGLNSLAEWLQPLQDTWLPLLNGFDADYDGELRAREAAERLALLLGPVHTEYLRLCQAEKKFDFLTLARRTRDLLQQVPEVRAELKDRYRYVMVDEFQDTNQLQWDIIAALVETDDRATLETDRLFIVGDPQQSIYRFRHADVGVFQRVRGLIEKSNRLHRREPVATDYDRFLGRQQWNSEQRLGLMPLVENYRSLAPLPLCLVDRIFEHVFASPEHGNEPQMLPFEVQYQHLAAGLAETNPSGEVQYIVPREPESDDDDAPSDESSATDDSVGPAQVRAVVEHLAALHGQPKRSAKEHEPPVLAWRDMAVLLPSRTTILTELTRELRRRGLPHVVTRGIGFWQRQEVRDVVNLASWLAGANDELALFAVLRGPIGERTDTEILFLSQLGRGSIERGLDHICSLSESASFMDDASVPPSLAEYWQALSEAQRQSLRETGLRLRRWRECVDRIAHAELFQRALEESGAHVLYAADDDGELMLANLRRLLGFVRDWEGRGALDLSRLARRLRALVEEAQREEQAPLDDGEDAIQVMTVHAAKGLEFPVVAILKMERHVDRGTRRRLLVKSPWDDLLPDDSAQLPEPAPGTIAVSVRHPRRPRETYNPILLGALRRLDRAQELAESRRLFYVAATRAKEHLILAGKEPTILKGGRPRALPECWQRWFEEALQLTEAHKKQGFWEDDGGRLRVHIITEVSDEPVGAERDIRVPDIALDLRRIPAAPSVPIVSIWQFLKLREWQGDAQSSAPLRSSEAVARVDALDGVLARKLMAVLVLNGLALARLPRRQLEALLSAQALQWLAAQHSQGWPDDANPFALAQPKLLASIVAEAQALLQEIRADRAFNRKMREILDADGDDMVPFELYCEGCRVFGCFDKLLTVDGRLRIVEWNADRKNAPEAIAARHRTRLQLMAQALRESGRAALNGREVFVEVVLLSCRQSLSLSFSPLKNPGAPRGE